MLITYAAQSGTSWPDAMIPITGIVIVGSGFIVLLWQIFATGRTAINNHRAKEFDQLVERFGESQERLLADVADIKAKVDSIERMLKEVD